MLKLGLSVSFRIRFVLLPPEIARMNAMFSNREDSLKEEVEEHYNILVMLQHTDREYSSQLISRHKRKQDIEKILLKSEHWLKFIKNILIAP